jgi:Transposase.
MTTRKHLLLGMQKEQSDATKKANIQIRDRRYFSESARRSIVEEIENGLSKAEAARRYRVSETSIYSWVAKHSKYYEKRLKTVTEHESDSVKLKAVEAELKEVYERLGRERAKSMFFEELIVVAEESLGMDLKKNFGTRPCSSTAAKNGRSKAKER